MITKTITYTDYSGNSRTEEFLFNLSRAEIIEMDMSVSGGMKAYIEQLSRKQDGAKIMSIFKDIIFKSYGEMSPDGRRFIKSPELSTEFMQTEAYDVLFVELVTNAEAAAAFVAGIMPPQSSLEAIANK